MKHTIEPWKTYKGNTHDIFANDGDFIASSEECHIGHREAAANAQRIVACVNACAGITNEALEKGIVLDSVKLHEAILDQQPSSFFKEYGVKVWEDV